MSIITEALRKAQDSRFEDVKDEFREKKISSVMDVQRIPDNISTGKRKKLVKFSISLLTIYVSIFFIAAVLAGLVFLRAMDSSLEQEQLSTNAKESGENVKVANLVSDQRRDMVSFLTKKKDHSDVPTRNPEPGQTSLPVLNGIMFSAEPTAIVNDMIVSPGDTVSGFRVIKISPGSVDIADDDGTYQLVLK